MTILDDISDDELNLNAADFGLDDDDLKSSVTPNQLKALQVMVDICDRSCGLSVSLSP
mgnify:CR=1 FL=1